MKTSRSVSKIDAYQRYKKYALVRDMAFSQLSREFFDAVMDVRDNRDENGGFDFTRLFNAFGTHYPYAVTYGAAGKLTTLMTEDSLTRNFESFTSDSGTASLTVNQGTVSGHIASSLRTRQGNTSTTGLGQTTFTAVGGNGSWNENGFAAGDAPYPILMDLRPISELLNPINFPRDPGIYTEMRAQPRRDRRVSAAVRAAASAPTRR
ncbi:MAG: MAC/perforin domain-containing protein [Steroidobacteraceae bacterium]